MKQTVLALGTSTIDHVIVVSHYPKADQKVDCKDIKTEGGGNAANSLVTLSRLGVGTRLVTKVGHDNEGTLIINGLKKEKVDTRFVVQEGERSTISFVVVDASKGTRTIINKKTSGYHGTITITGKELEGISAVYLDGRYMKSALQLGNLAKRKNIPVIVEAERPRKDQYKLFKLADVVITSEIYHQMEFGNTSFENNLKLLKSFGPSLIITTKGSKGVIALDDNGYVTVPSYKVKVVDTLGAGDAFIGGFIFAFMQKKWDLVKKLKFASKVAALKCGVLGARSGLPFKNDKRLASFFR